MKKNTFSLSLRTATAASAVAVLLFASTACSSKTSASSSAGGTGGTSTSPTAPHSNGALAAITSQDTLTAAVKRALQAGKGSGSGSCDAVILTTWEQAVGAGYLADKTTGDPQGIAAKMTGGRAFLDAQGRLVGDADAQQTQAYSTWLTDPAVVKASFKRFGDEMTGYLDGTNGQC